MKPASIILESFSMKSNVDPCGIFSSSLQSAVYQFEVPSKCCGWGVGFFSKVVAMATFNYVGGSFNLFMTTTEDV